MDTHRTKTSGCNYTDLDFKGVGELQLTARTQHTLCQMIGSDANLFPKLGAGDTGKALS